MTPLDVRLFHERAFRDGVSCATCGVAIVRGSVVIVLRTHHAFGLVTHAVAHVRCPVPVFGASRRRGSGAA